MKNAWESRLKICTRLLETEKRSGLPVLRCLLTRAWWRGPYCPLVVLVQNVAPQPTDSALGLQIVVFTSRTLSSGGFSAKVL